MDGSSAAGAVPPPGRWVALVEAAAVPSGTVVAVEVDDLRLAVWRGTDGQVAAVDARCPHQWADLAQVGDVEGCELVCSSHGWRFDPGGVGTKVSVLGRRDRKGDVAAHPCRERDGVIEARLADGGPAG